MAVISTVGVAQLQVLRINPRLHHNLPRLYVIVQELRHQIHRQAVEFVAGEDGVANVVLGLLDGVRELSRGVVALARVDREPLAIPERHLDVVVLAVEFHVAGRENQHVDVLGSGGDLLESTLEVVAVAEEPAAGPAEISAITSLANQAAALARKD